VLTSKLYKEFYNLYKELFKEDIQQRWQQAGRYKDEKLRKILYDQNNS
jgi:hypothetical protein